MMIISPDVGNGFISKVSLYPSRAVLIREYSVVVRAGHNLVQIDGLPNSIDRDSLQVDGNGPATIQDVSLSWLCRPQVPTTSDAIQTLIKGRNHLVKDIDRCKKSIDALHTYLSTLSVDRVPVADLSNVIDGYQSVAKVLDHQLLELESKLTDVDASISTETTALPASVSFDDNLKRRVSIALFADSDGQLQLFLHYAVNGASWTPVYDVRVNVNESEPVELIYKASITQNTAEDWKDVPLTLETASPTIGLTVPTLPTWSLSTPRPIVVHEPPVMRAASASLRTRSRLPPSAASVDGDDINNDDVGSILHRVATVSSRGTVSTTFQVPGKISIPSDNAPHNVTIASLQLPADFSWVCVPKRDTRPRLSAKIKNVSEYTLMSGFASVYVDGSFIARTTLPIVSPNEPFNCPLGLDPSIRVTYHPLAKKCPQSGYYLSGLYQKSTQHNFTQAITVHNTKSISVENVRVLDQFPVSEDEKIQVKVVAPALSSLAAPNTIGSGLAGLAEKQHRMQVQPGVVALWDGADEPDADIEAFGRNGKFSWVCSIPPQGKVNLQLQWEVTAPPKTDIPVPGLCRCLSGHVA